MSSTTAKTTEAAKVLTMIKRVVRFWISAILLSSSHVFGQDWKSAKVSFWLLWLAYLFPSHLVSMDEVYMFAVLCWKEMEKLDY